MIKGPYIICSNKIKQFIRRIKEIFIESFLNTKIIKIITLSYKCLLFKVFRSIHIMMVFRNWAFHPLLWDEGTANVFAHSNRGNQGLEKFKDLLKVTELGLGCRASKAPSVVFFSTCFTDSRWKVWHRESERALSNLAKAN